MISYRQRNWAMALTSVVCLAFAAYVGLSLFLRPEFSRPPIGGPFSLVDRHGAEVTEVSFLERHMLLYFGYTSCPDVCPTRLVEMSQALELLPAEKAAQVTPVFVSVDPARDTPELLREYMPHFHERFVALTGPKPSLDAMVEGYHAYYREVPGEDEADYLIDHTSYVYLMGPDGRYLTHFTANLNAAEMAEQMAQLVEAQ